VGRITCSRPCSALRLSQPLSGFLASSNFVALFRAPTVHEVSPSESSPREDHVPLSRPLAPLPLSPVSLGAPSEALSGLVSGSDVHVNASDKLFPPTPMRFLSASRSCIPVPLDLSGRTHPPQPLHRLRSLPPFASPFTPAWVSPKPKADPLLAFLPL